MVHHVWSVEFIFVLVVVTLICSMLAFTLLAKPGGRGYWHVIT